MPKDVLRSFSSNIDFPDDIIWEVSGMLARQQRALETLRMCHTNSTDLFIAPSGFGEAGLGQLKHIECSSWDEIDISKTQPDKGLYTLRRPKLETLDLALYNLHPEDIREPSESDLAMATSGYLHRFLPHSQIASTLPQQSTCQSPESLFGALQHLRLKDACLGLPAAATMCEVFNIRQLKSLTLQYCDHIAPLLQLLTTSGGLSLKHLVLVTDSMGSVPTSTTKELLSSLVGSFSGLKTLVMDITQMGNPPLDVDTMPSVWAIGSHSATLEILCLDFGDEKYDLVHLHILARLLTRVQQLGLIFPAINLQFVDLHDWGNPNYVFAASMKAIAALPRLVTLHIRRLPKTSWLQCHTPNTDPRNKITTDYLMQEASTKCMSEIFKSKPLRVLAWGGMADFLPGEDSSALQHHQSLAGEDHECDGWSGIQVFARSEKRDLIGGHSVVASVPNGRLKHYEPAVEILSVIEPVDGFLRF
ncbi:hypothetical protein LTR56_000946 [Elasticomyces elasticus]|nr:hypothetical protein LTR56_000946 [Elasticomyces elasticus]KAK3665520.1 hypothetical protein LTR22_003750 [Elasticomyces elasticus]KAK4929837.1 hypothetical protein LTR49_003464 [Elasticomyces elasticus]KAK5759462.1 hypothetical protein LTS12_010475 [Elasticomyces elasticus]